MRLIVQHHENLWQSTTSATVKLCQGKGVDDYQVEFGRDTFMQWRSSARKCMGDGFAEGNHDAIHDVTTTKKLLKDMRAYDSVKSANGDAWDKMLDVAEPVADIGLKVAEIASKVK